MSSGISIDENRLEPVAAGALKAPLKEAAPVADAPVD